ncbi:MAG: MoxR family ATPase [Myxococcota bacterium]|nr:MoxR family ATPase [Myxococcota bacterium]
MSEEATTEPVAAAWRALAERVEATVIGQSEALRQAFLTLLCGGHALLEGVPGVAKTLLVRSLAGALDVRFGRIQFTPDLMPGDVIGTPVYRRDTGRFEFRPGPVFTDLLLADEINRAPAKSQAALLEAMQERHVTVDGQSHPLGEDFAVFATQNPVEQEGTYPLPEAELDRFLFKIRLDYPSEEDERAILVRHHADDPVPAREAGPPVLRAGDLHGLRAAVRGVIVRDAIVAYVAALARATREDVQFALGASPRAAVLLLRAAKAEAALAGRDFVIPEDVQAVWPAVMRHRVLLDPAAEVEGLTPDRALERTLAGVPVPH